MWERPLAAADGQSLALARFFLCADSPREARELAASFIRSFAENMGVARTRIARMLGTAPAELDAAHRLANAIVGDAAA